MTPKSTVHTSSQGAKGATEASFSILKRQQPPILILLKAFVQVPF